MSFEWTASMPDGDSATVSIETDAPNDVAVYMIQGDGDIARMLRSELPTAAGMMGHLIGQESTAIDLDYALRGYSFLLIDGPELDYDLGLPDDALS